MSLVKGKYKVQRNILSMMTRGFDCLKVDDENYGAGEGKILFQTR